MKNIKILFTILATLGSLNAVFSSNTVANDPIIISDGHVDPVPIAINDFAHMQEEDANITKDILKVVNRDLKTSGIFRPISKAAFIERQIGTQHTPLFASWQQINANLLLNGDVARTASGKLQVRFILWDPLLEAKIASESFELPEKLWRRAAHKISDIVYEKITGSKGYFNTRIVYVSESGDYLNRKKRLALMDYDGANHQYLTDGSDLVLTPRFSPDARKIIYLSYKNRIPQVHMLNLNNGGSSVVGKFPGMSFAPRFSPDGKFAIMSIAKKGITQIYEINLKTKKLKQLTKGGSINTSPNYSPDGKKIIFNSDRGGRRHLYIMNRDGSNVERISHGNGSYAEPQWSSKNIIAFTKMSKNLGFTIGVMHPQTKAANCKERIISRGYLVESPAWAANGRMMVYTKGAPPRGKYTKGLNRIYTIDFLGNNENIVPTPGDASDPDWSRDAL